MSDDISAPQRKAGLSAARQRAASQVASPHYKWIVLSNTTLGVLKIGRAHV